MQKHGLNCSGASPRGKKTPRNPPDPAISLSVITPSPHAPPCPSSSLWRRPGCARSRAAHGRAAPGPAARQVRPRAEAGQARGTARARAGGGLTRGGAGLGQVPEQIHRRRSSRRPGAGPIRTRGGPETGPRLGGSGRAALAPPAGTRARNRHQSHAGLRCQSVLWPRPLPPLA